MNQVDRQSPNEEDSLAWVIEGNRVSLGDLTGMTLGDFHVDQLLGAEEWAKFTWRPRSA